MNSPNEILLEESPATLFFYFWPTKALRWRARWGGRGRGARPRGQPAATRAHTRVGRGALCLPRAARLARVYTVHVFESKHLPRDSPSATEDLTISGAKFQNCQYDTGVRTGVLVLP